MGLIKAITGATGGVLADQWKEFFYCDSLSKEVLAVKGQKRISSRSSNKKGEDNIISNGSGIAVADGQCMIIVEQGKVVEFCAEPGEFTWNSSTEPSLFAGPFGNSLKETFKTIGRRFTFGGDTAKDQRVYYFNTKEMLDNKFGTPTPIPFRVVDRNVGIDREVDLRINGTYTYRLVNPLLFYTNICGNTAQEYRREEIAGQLKADFIQALMPAVGRLSDLELRPNQLMSHTRELRDYLNEEMNTEWTERRGIRIEAVSLGAVTLTEEDAARLKEDQRLGMFTDPTRAAALLSTAQADAMKTAAGNSAGAMTGFMGMGMAMHAGGGNAQNLYAMSQQMQPQQPTSQAQPASSAGPWACSCGAHPTGKFCPECGAKKPEPKPAADSWKCVCGTMANGKFCPECGAPRPVEDGWTCSCGTVNKGKFCQNCGARRPAGAPVFRCDKCGWEPEDPHHPPKFCPECGDRFDEHDMQ